MLNLFITDQNPHDSILSQRWNNIKTFVFRGKNVHIIQICLVFFDTFFKGRNPRRLGFVFVNGFEIP